MHIQSILTSVVQFLNDHADVTVKRSEIAAPVSDDVLAAFAKKSIEISEDILAIYKQVDGFEIKWSQSDGDLSGEIVLPSLLSLLDKDARIFRFFKNQIDSDELDDLKAFRVIGGSHDSVLLGFLIEDGEMTAEIYTLFADADGFGGPIEIEDESKYDNSFHAFVVNMIRTLGTQPEGDIAYACDLDDALSAISSTFPELVIS